MQKAKRKTVMQHSRDQFAQLAMAYRDCIIDAHTFHNRASLLGPYWEQLAMFYIVQLQTEAWENIQKRTVQV